MVINTVAEVFGVETETLKVRSYGSRVRAVAAKMLMRYSGLNQRDAGMLLNIGSGAAVCQQLKCLRESVETDKALTENLKRIDAKLLRCAR